MPRVSVITPTYNRADMIGGAIQSVLDQTYVDWELIVVDDGSTDNTAEVVSAYDDPRMEYIYQENRKLPGARNTGLRAAKGEYVAFLDSDDVFLPGKLELQVAVLDQKPGIGLVASGWTEINAERRPIRTVRPWRLGRGLTLSDWLYACPFNVLTVLVRREWLDRVGLFDEQQHYVEDWDLWLRMANSGCCMVWEPAIVCLRTIHAGNMVRNAAAMSEGLFRMLDKFFDQQPTTAAVRRHRDRVYANAHLNAAVRFLAARAVDTGAQHLKMATDLDPSLLGGVLPRALQSVASTALTHQVCDLAAYIADARDALRMVSPHLARSQRQIRAAIWATAAFEDLANGQSREARCRAAWALVTDPSWVRNRGLVKILVGRQTTSRENTDAGGLDRST